VQSILQITEQVTLTDSNKISHVSLPCKTLCMHL